MLKAKLLLFIFVLQSYSIAFEQRIKLISKNHSLFSQMLAHINNPEAIQNRLRMNPHISEAELGHCDHRHELIDEIIYQMGIFKNYLHLVNTSVKKVDKPVPVGPLINPIWETQDTILINKQFLKNSDNLYSTWIFFVEWLSGTSGLPKQLVFEQKLSSDPMLKWLYKHLYLYKNKDFNEFNCEICFHRSDTKSQMSDSLFFVQVEELYNFENHYREFLFPCPKTEKDIRYPVKLIENFQDYIESRIRTKYNPHSQKSELNLQTKADSAFIMHPLSQKIAQSLAAWYKCRNYRLPQKIQLIAPFIKN